MDPAYYVVIHHTDNEGQPTDEVGRFPCLTHSDADNLADELDNNLIELAMYRYYIEIVDA